MLLNQIHRKLIFLKNSKNQKFRTEKISDLAEFRRINIRTEKIRKFVPPKCLGVNVYKTTQAFTLHCLITFERGLNKVTKTFLAKCFNHIACKLGNKGK